MISGIPGDDGSCGVMIQICDTVVGRLMMPKMEHQELGPPQGVRYSVCALNLQHTFHTFGNMASKVTAQRQQRLYHPKCLYVSLLTSTQSYKPSIKTTKT